MIEVNNLKKRVSNKMEIDIPELTINTGITCLVGENGSGKTTLMRLLLNLIKPNSGYITIDGIDNNKSEAWKSITASYLGEDSLIPFLSPSEYINLIEDLFHVKYSELPDAVSGVRQFMDDALLAKAENIGRLSTGEKKRLGIVTALLKQPKYLMLDEPFSNLDISHCAALSEILIKYKERNTLVISSHNLDLVADLSDVFLVLDKGRIVYNCCRHDFSTTNSLKEALKEKISSSRN